MSEKKPTKHLVVWSGGLDSTFLLWQLAKQYGTATQPIRTITFVHPQIGDLKNEAEKLARRRFRLFAKSTGLHMRFCEVELKHVASTDPTDAKWAGLGDGAGHLQAVLWLSLASVYAERDEQIHFGYVRGDDIWHYREQFAEAFRSLAIVKGIWEHVSCEFDLEWESKAEVLLRALAQGLPRDCWWSCESPRRHDKAIVRCDSRVSVCNPCRTFLKTIHEIQRWHRPRPPERKILRQLIADGEVEIPMPKKIRAVPVKP